MPADVAARTNDDLIVKNPDTFPRDGRLDPDALEEMVSIMVEGEELAAMPQGGFGRYLDESLLSTK